MNENTLTMDTGEVRVVVEIKGHGETVTQQLLIMPELDDEQVRKGLQAFCRYIALETAYLVATGHRYDGKSPVDQALRAAEIARK
jgi:hypothetical protein